MKLTMKQLMDKIEILENAQKATAAKVVPLLMAVPKAKGMVSSLNTLMICRIVAWLSVALYGILFIAVSVWKSPAALIGLLIVCCMMFGATIGQILAECKVYSTTKELLRGLRYV